MNHYLDIEVLPDPEFKPPQLLNALFSKLHRALVTIASKDIGVSFPEATNKSLGQRLRLHGTEIGLATLMEQCWLKGLKNYTCFTSIQPVPAQIKYYCTVSRVQAKSNVERLRRRSIRKGWLSAEQAKEQIPDLKNVSLDLPFIQIKSLSTGQHFRLFIKHGKRQSTAVNGFFSYYGLSQTATIPYF